MTQLPTVVRDHILLSNPASAKQAELNTVTVEGRRYFIGRTAMLQGRADDTSYAPGSYAWFKYA